MGDVIHTMYAVAALRASHPGMLIGWAIEQRWAELLCGPKASKCKLRSPERPLVDSIHLFDTKRWRKAPFTASTRRQILAAFKDVRGKNYEMVVDFQGAMKSAVVARLSSGRETVGFAHPREAPARLFYRLKVEAAGEHVVEQYRALAEAVANTVLPATTPEFPRDAGSQDSIAARFSPQEKLVILSPGAGWAAKQWPSERYGQLAKMLAEEGFTPVINYGPGDEGLAAAAQAASQGTSVAISSTVSELIALSRRAHLFIGGDTGPMHLAAALKIPVVALFGPTDPARNGPFATRSEVLRHPASRTSLSHTSVPEPGLLKITAAEVLQAARRLLQVVNA
jgi:heptosyltransferase-1